MEKIRTGAIVLAGGQGKRMQSQVQKQYMMLDGKPLIVYALEAFDQSTVDQIVLVVAVGELEFVKKQILSVYSLKKTVLVTEGGKERYDSVYAGLKVLSGCAYVLIHDGARPLITPELIDRTIEGVKKYQACVVGVPAKDTIKIIDADGCAAETPDRSLLWQVQTPQAFNYALVRQAYEGIMGRKELLAGVTDDAMVVESQTDQKIKLILGSYENLKITTPEDLVMAESFLLHRKKVGSVK